MAKVGGKRPGAGRPAGSLNQRNAELTAELLGSGKLPIEYMLEVMRDEEASPADRKWAAEKASPFIHPRPAPTTRTVTIDLPDTSTADGMVKAANVVLIATAKGEIAPAEAQAIMSVLELGRKAIETVEVIARLDRLEAQLGKR